jgi:hypothetical protein
MHGSFHHAHGVPSEPCSATAAMAAQCCKRQGAFKFDDNQAGARDVALASAGLFGA